MARHLKDIEHREDKPYMTRLQGGLTWGEGLTGAGLGLVLIGGMAADSPGNGYLYAGGIVLVGLALAFLGQRLQAIAARKANMSMFKKIGKDGKP